MDYDNKVYVKISSSAIYGPVTTTDTWYHVLSQTRSVYVNGTDQTSGRAISSDMYLLVLLTFIFFHHLQIHI